jgi:hypothetical protein
MLETSLLRIKGQRWEMSPQPEFRYPVWGCLLAKSNLEFKRKDSVEPHVNRTR